MIERHMSPAQHPRMRLGIFAQRRVAAHHMTVEFERHPANSIAPILRNPERRSSGNNANTLNGELFDPEIVQVPPSTRDGPWVVIAFPS
jgi:hypothetical protein